MAAAKMKCDTNQAMSNVGLFFLRNPTIDARGASTGGGRAVNGVFASSGDCTIIGKITEETNVTSENTIKAVLPILPTSPVRSNER